MNMLLIHYMVSACTVVAPKRIYFASRRLCRGGLGFGDVLASTMLNIDWRQFRLMIRLVFHNNMVVTVLLLSHDAKLDEVDGVSSLPNVRFCLLYKN